MGRVLVTMGVVLIVIGMLWELGLNRVPFFRLPGDFHWKVGEVHIYVPLMTSFILSVLLSLFFLVLRLMK
ncbi:MAG: hypothetical protein BSOLF_0703 [Candidatus Carbobacillus altaicus]|uniref:DUF2905 domain-containing protein n=1 Tax=Candidatus Carbonibacillus altaicus TaxID=2163959 RepID=A0A2R6Y592_9BACL|nr:MAG: hypothetical protein BSOLF_0703 [Candidatus Carbobacillus altaicus]